MTTQDIVIVIGAIGAVLVSLGAGLKWLISAIITSQKENTAAVTEASVTMTKAITESSAVQVAATNSLRLELREHRVEMRTFHGMRPPESDEPSDDGEPAPLTPIRGVPATPSYLITRKKT